MPERDIWSLCVGLGGGWQIHVSSAAVAAAAAPWLGPQKTGFYGKTKKSSAFGRKKPPWGATPGNKSFFFVKKKPWGATPGNKNFFWRKKNPWGATPGNKGFFGHKSLQNTPQMAPNEKVGFRVKVDVSFLKVNFFT